MPCFSRMRWNCLATSPSRPGSDAVEHLDHGDLRAEPPPHRAELKPDIAAADHDHALRHLVQRERAGRGNDRLLVDGDAGDGRDLRAGGDHDGLGLDRLLLAVDEGDLDLPGAERCGLCRGNGRSCSSCSRNATPSTLPFTPSSLNASMAARSSSGFTLMPMPAKSWAASAKASLACSSAFDGMQPTLRQVPPWVARFSTTATFMPSCAARMAHDIAAGPGADDDEIVSHMAVYPPTARASASPRRARCPIVPSGCRHLQEHRRSASCFPNSRSRDCRRTCRRPRTPSRRPSTQVIGVSALVDVDRSLIGLTVGAFARDAILAFRRRYDRHRRRQRFRPASASRSPSRRPIRRRARPHRRSCKSRGSCRPN